jgi:hypothetical protein
MTDTDDSLWRSHHGEVDEYEDQTVNAVVGELLRNAFDAVKAAQYRGLITRGQIDITSDSRTRLVALRDNGIGMTADTVRAAFLDRTGRVPSDLPDSLRSSSGRGYGKNMFLFGTDELRLVTVRDGFKSGVTTTPGQVKNRTFKVHSGPTQEPNGTVIRVKLPQSSAHRRLLYIPSTPYFITPLHALFTGQAVDITYNGKRLNNRPQSEKIDTLKFDWGAVDLYAARVEHSKPRQQVLAAGMFQFTEPFEAGFHRDFEVALDVHPHVSPEHPRYPFNPHDGGWHESIAADVKTLRGQVKQALYNAHCREVAEEYSTVTVMPYSNPQYPAPVNAYLMSTRTLALPHRNADRCGDSSSQFRFDPEQLPAHQPLLHSKLDFDLTARLDAALGRSAGQSAATQMFCELGSAVRDYVRTVSKLPGYEGLKDYRAGITLDRDLAGVNVQVPFKGILINPYYTKLFDALHSQRGVAGGLLNLLHHEAVHEKVSLHNNAFTCELTELTASLYERGHHDRLFNALHTVVQRHWQAYQLGRELYEGGGARLPDPGFAERPRHAGRDTGNSNRAVAHGDRGSTKRGRQPSVLPALGRGPRDVAAAGPDANLDPASARTVLNASDAAASTHGALQAARDYRQQLKLASRPAHPIAPKSHDTDLSL